MKVIIRNLEEVKDFLKKLPRGTLRVGLRAFSEYIRGDATHGLRHYEPYKYVKPFRSYSLDPSKAAKQRRWIFAHLDIIGKNNRTNATANAWELIERNGGYNISLQNISKGAGWLWSPKYQTRHQKAVGHRLLPDKIASNINGAKREAIRASVKWIKENKPKG